jgi:hypothetical protein
MVSPPHAIARKARGRLGVESSTREDTGMLYRTNAKTMCGSYLWLSRETLPFAFLILTGAVLSPRTVYLVLESLPNHYTLGPASL